MMSVQWYCPYQNFKRISKSSWISGQFSWISMQKVVGEWYYLNLVTNTGHQPKKSGRNQDGHHLDDHHTENVVFFIISDHMMD